MRKRTVLLLVFVLFISINGYAPNLSDKIVEQQFWQHQLAQSRKRVEKKRAKELSRFLHAIGHSESGNNPKAYNRYGYIGKYQFGHVVRKACGYGDIKFLEFKKNPSIWSEKDQETAMITLLLLNEKTLRGVIRKHDGKYIKGKRITKSGILAAAHLAGAGGVKRYFRYGFNPKDAYGTGLEDYLFKFSGFNI